MLAPTHTGALLAVAALQQAAAPGVMCLRGVNPYVGAALGDWRKRAGEAPLVPRAPAAAPQLAAASAVAGDSDHAKCSLTVSRSVHTA
jgi:hypothetical protein